MKEARHLRSSSGVWHAVARSARALADRWIGTVGTFFVGGLVGPNGCLHSPR